MAPNVNSEEDRVELRVLVADDSAVMRAMIVKSLRLAGLPLGDVYQAADGAEALRLLEEHWVDLALVDINMPVMDGEELIVRLRSDEATADLPVLVVSTEGSETRIARLRAAGAAFLRKPFTPEDLCSAIVQLIGVEPEEGADGGGCDIDF